MLEALFHSEIHGQDFTRDPIMPRIFSMVFPDRFDIVVNFKTTLAIDSEWIEH